MEHKIKALLEVIYSKRDMYGNCYWAGQLTETSTGKVVSFTISGGEGNITGAASVLYGFGSQAWTTMETMLPIREFNRLTKKWPYFGCPPEEIAGNIKKALVA